jgi:hypothetical protein
LPEWHDELLKIAKKRAYLGTGSHAAENGEASLNFLAEPRLRFDSENQPFFETSLVGLADHDLSPQTTSIFHPWGNFKNNPSQKSNDELK